MTTKSLASFVGANATGPLRLAVNSDSQGVVVEIAASRSRAAFLASIL